jgi:hypothetical protein
LTAVFVAEEAAHIAILPQGSRELGRLELVLDFPSQVLVVVVVAKHNLEHLVA